MNDKKKRIFGDVAAILCALAAIGIFYHYAFAATQVKTGVRCVGTVNGSNPEIATFPEAASQGFKKGEMVYLVSGYVTEFTDTIDDGSTRFLGFAAEDSHNSTAGAYNVKVWVANSFNKFLGSVGTGSSATSVSNATMTGTAYPFYFDTTNSIVQVNVAAPAGNVHAARVIDRYKGPNHAWGDTYGWVYFIVDASGRFFDR